MGNYIYAPAGPKKLDVDIIKSCIEYIGKRESGIGSDIAKGKRYLKRELHCSGKSIKRMYKRCTKTQNHDFERYGLEVFYYNKYVTAEILHKVIDYLRKYCEISDREKLFGCVPKKDDEYLKLIYSRRLSQLIWVSTSDYNGQGTDAEELYRRIV